jgi:hypothetical protein
MVGENEQTGQKGQYLKDKIRRGSEKNELGPLKVFIVLSHELS